MQLEIPIESVELAVQLAKGKGKLVILNPAPAPPLQLTEMLLNNIDIIIPNETESEIISGIKVKDKDSAIEAARRIHQMGVKKVIITLGSKGSLLFDGEQIDFIPAFKVNAIDTTAAGDCFCAALSITISEGQVLTEAIQFAS